MNIEDHDCLSFLEQESRVLRFSKKRIVKKSFLVAFILHLLLIVFFIHYALIKPPEYQKSPQQQAMPSYLYTSPVQPAFINQQKTAAAKQAQASRKETPTPEGLKPVSAESFFGFSEPILQTSKDIMRTNQINRAVSKSKDVEPILLIGDKNTDPNPLIILMARALSKHFAYPKYEGHFGIRARVIVEITMHPEGFISDPEIIESSNNSNFDTAALYAINKAPLVVGANRYLKKPKTYTVGFLFN